MKRFITLDIKNDNASIKTLLDKMKSAKNLPFYYDEEKSKQADPTKGGVQDVMEYAIFHTESPQYYKSYVYLAVKDKLLQLVNITSPEKSELGVSNYNTILNAFFFDFVVKFINATFSVNITGEELSIKEQIGDETYEALESWARACNRTSPLVHPDDRNRWFEFLRLAAMNNVSLSSTELEEWLKEDEHWPEALDDIISDITINYEYSIDLLKYVADNS